jgi:hypothetical protein
MHERDYLRIKRGIEEKYRKDLEALETTWQNALAHGAAKKEGSSGGIKRGDLQSAILRAIGQFSCDFKAEDVLAKIKVTSPEIGEKTGASSVSSALKRMNGREIETVIRGVGRTPSLYRLKKADLKVVGN